MLKLNTLLLGAILATMGLGLSTPAMAQFEVAPDHYKEHAQEPAQSKPSKNEQARYSRIADLQSELDGYQWQIKQRASAVETARRLANGAGGEGEFASVFIDEYVHRYHELEKLKQDLAPLIRVAQSKLSQITSDLATRVPRTSIPNAENWEKQQPVLQAESRRRQRHHLSAFAQRMKSPLSHEPASTGEEGRRVPIASGRAGSF